MRQTRYGCLRASGGCLIIDIFDDLAEFARWWLHHRMLLPPPNAVTTYQNMTGTCLYRHGQYQVQMFTSKPNSVSVSHVHPNVDSYELYLCGDLDFVIAGNIYKHQEVAANPIPVRIHPHYWHEGTTGPLGGSFLSLQKWLNNMPPSCVGEDWVGADGSAAGTCVGRTETKE